jgi:hypothetical protein
MADQTFEEYAAAQDFDVREAYRVIGQARRIAKGRDRAPLTEEQIEAYVADGWEDPAKVD